MKSFTLIAVTLTLFSCNYQLKFDKNEWNRVSDPAFPPDNRIHMIGDLTENYKLKGRSKKQLITLLGVPDYSDDTSMVYQLSIDYRGIDVAKAEKLIFKLSKDSLVRSFETKVTK